MEVPWHVRNCLWTCLLLVLLSACRLGEAPQPSATPAAPPASPSTQTPTPSPDQVVTPTRTPVPTLTSTPTPAPAGDIGWRKVKGVVYAETATVGHEVAGALVKCSQFSYFPREESCAPYRVTTGSDGVFEFDVFVHDTDSITLVAQKPGYGPAERRIRGIDCFGNCPPVDLALLESVTP
jgi:hypothetical protein